MEQMPQLLDDELDPQGSTASSDDRGDVSFTHTESSTTQDRSSKVDGLIGTKVTMLPHTFPIHRQQIHDITWQKGLPIILPSVSWGKEKTARKGKCEVENPNITKSGKNAYSLPKSTLKHYSTHWKDASRLAHLTWGDERRWLSFGNPHTRHLLQKSS